MKILGNKEMEKILKQNYRNPIATDLHSLIYQ